MSFCLKNENDKLIKYTLINSFKYIEEKLDNEHKLKYEIEEEPSVEWANKYLDLNCMLLEKGWRPVIPRHPRESDK